MVFHSLNTVGIIDSDYYNNKDNEGHIMLGIRFNGGLNKESKFIAKKERICQGIIMPFYITDNDNVSR